jgi:hypothetical protein
MAGRGQVTWFTWLRGQRNQLTAGSSIDRSSLDFRQSTQLGYLNPDRSVTGVDSYGDGRTGGMVDGEPYDTRVDLRGSVRTFSLYATDTLSVGNRLAMTISGRYNRTVIENRDLINPSPGAGAASRIARWSTRLFADEPLDRADVSTRGRVQFLWIICRRESGSNLR